MAFVPSIPETLRPCKCLMSKTQFTLFFEVVNEKDGKKGDANLSLDNYVVVKIVVIVLEANLRIAF
jgi:hypothetical protein